MDRARDDPDRRLGREGRFSNEDPVRGFPSGPGPVNQAHREAGYKHAVPPLFRHLSTRHHGEVHIKTLLAVSMVYPVQVVDEIRSCEEGLPASPAAP